MSVTYRLQTAAGHRQPSRGSDEQTRAEEERRGGFEDSGSGACEKKRSARGLLGWASPYRGSNGTRTYCPSAGGAFADDR